MALMCVLPTLEGVQSLNKLAQNKDTFICDFVSIVKLCQFEIYTMYVDLEKQYSQDQFHAFVDLVTLKNNALWVEWWIDLESHVEFVGFFFIQHLYMLRKINKTTKYQCTFANKGFITELDRRFPIQDLMNATNIIYLQY